MREIGSIAAKELVGFFASPVAYLFLGAFLGVSLFVFFWVETFFARNIADLRPLFDWMPVLLIFLVATLTMRMWSEERRSGTIELLLTAPVSPLRLVLGKFIACLGLVVIALLLTAPLPVTVDILGPLDWGPVIGAYLASLSLATAYLSIGLFVSSRSDNPIVSLLGTTLIGGIFYVLGTETLTGLVGHRGTEWLQLLGAGSRFQSITRGVIDLRDLYYYLSLTGVFLTLNVYTLERLRWAEDHRQRTRQQAYRWTAGLVAANLLAANLWLQPIDSARADLTAGRMYSISDTTRNYLDRLQEPLLIRGYFSARTHPLLAPLVPQLRDLLREYAIAAKGRVRVEFVDPHDDPELEREAGEKYGIRPVAFQTASKYQAAVVNSYFDILVQYGNEYDALSYRDLIDVKLNGDSDLEVRLRNPEYDLTRSIKKVLYGYRGGGNLFEGIRHPLRLVAYVSPRDRLPEPLADLRDALQLVLAEIKGGSQGRFTFELEDPDAGEGKVARQIANDYGFRPIALSLLDANTFHFHLLLQSEQQAVPIPLPETLDKASLQRGIEAAIKRFASGVLRSVALYTPPPASPFAQSGERYTLMEEGLRDNAQIQGTDLASGRVPESADLLLVVSPEELDEKQVFAIDQFLMQGGTVILAASPFAVDFAEQAITARKRPTGLESWLRHQGLTLEERLVLDPQNTAFPIPVQRSAGGFTIQEIINLPYPFFPDIRRDGMEPDIGIATGIDQLTLSWPSPIRVDAERNRQRQVQPLLQSSAASWTTASTDIQPDFSRFGELGFAESSDHGRKWLGVVVQGAFESYFKGRPAPLAHPSSVTAADTDTDTDTEHTPAKDKPAADQVTGVIERSPSSARLILIGSASCVGDSALDLALQATRSRYLTPVQWLENAVDWSLEDRDLLAIRGRSQFSRMLEPSDHGAQLFWEYLNYGLALAGLGLLFGLHRQYRARRERYYLEIFATGRG